MRNTIIFLLFVVLGCRASERDLVKPELLFQTWRRTAGLTNGQPTLNAYPFIVEFARNRTLLYGTEKRMAWCCSPATFTSTERTIEFFWPTKPDPQCALVDCALIELTVGPVWQIKTLTATELVITTNNQSITFEVVG